MNLTKAQQRAVTTSARRVCVRAGAGSGKTGVLVNRIMHLIESDTALLDRIVAITFTEKAALEMKARLREACRARAPKDDPDQLTFWRNVERSVSGSRISTIHGFCAGLLREHALYLGGDPDFAMLEDADSHLLRHDSAQQELLRLLQDDDADAVLLTGELGFGATFDAMRALLRSGSESARAFMHMGDFSSDAVKHAWSELERDAKDYAVRYVRADPRPRTFRSALQALGGCCSHTGDPREALRLELISECESMGSISAYNEIPAAYKRLKARAGSTKKDRWTPEDVPDQILNIRKAFQEMLKEYCWNTLPAEDDDNAALLTGAFLRVHAKVLSAYDSAKQTRVTHDFDDLIIRARQILTDHPVIRARVAHSMSHLLMDEFQDTDGLQYDIAKSLHDVEEGPSLFVVGDAKQSIYLFRGAEVETFQDVEASAEEVILLDENFRSLPGVLEFVNDFFTDTGRLAAVEPEYGRLSAHRDASSDTNVAFLVPEAIDGKPVLADYRHAEAEILASRLTEMVETQVTIGERRDGDEVRRPVQYGDMAILLRAMSEVHIYEQALRRYGVPFTVVAGAGFYERQEIRDLRNFLSVVADPSDEMALLAFLRSPLAGLSDDALAYAAGVVSGEATPLTRFMASDAALPDPEQQHRLEQARGLLARARDRREWSAPNLLRFVLSETGYEAMLLRQEFLGEQRAINVRKLVALAESFSRSRSPGLIQFLRYLEDVVKTEIREGDALELSHDRDAVTIMTIHQSKGLEFPVIAIADTGRSTASKAEGTVARHRSLGIALRTMDEDGNNLEPAAWSCINAMRKWQDRAESARMLYVALTRARDYLLIGGPTGDRNTWMHAFDQWLDLSSKRDGETISGTAWRGVVWRSAHAKPKTADKSKADAPPSVDVLRRRISAISAAPRLHEITITRLAAHLAQGAEAGNTAAQSQAPANPMALIRGTVAHRMLQLWDFEKDAPPAIAALLHSTPLDAPSREQLAHDLNAIADRFRGSELFKRLRAEESFDRELQVQWMVEGVTLNGVIDARLRNQTLVDYKTGAQHSSLSAQYAWQLRLYAAALRAVTGTAPPGGMLCYLDAEAAPCVEVPFSDSEIDETEQRVRALLPSLRPEAV